MDEVGCHQRMQEESRLGQCDSAPDEQAQRHSRPVGVPKAGPASAANACALATPGGRSSGKPDEPGIDLALREMAERVGLLEAALRDARLSSQESHQREKLLIERLAASEQSRSAAIALVHDRQREVERYAAFVNERQLEIRQLAALVQDRQQEVERYAAFVDERQREIEGLSAMVRDGQAEIERQAVRLKAIQGSLAWRLIQMLRAPLGRAW